jgi:hypothetical protein
MFFYCTTKIKNYYKVGIANSLNQIKKRLTTYRSANPKTNIKFFSEIGYNSQHIEFSFKNKFDHFRIGRSECYKLKFDILYKHFLKFQHKFKKLHHFWHHSTCYLSEYYFDKQAPEYKYDLTERDQREGRFDGFVPIAVLNYVDVSKDKKGGDFRIKANILDIKNVNLKQYQIKYNKHLEEKWYGQQNGYATGELKKFFKENFKIKKNIDASNIEYAENPINELIYKNFELKYKSLLKKYAEDKNGTFYWEKPEQRSIFRQKSMRMMNKVVNRFEEKYNITEALRGVSSVLPRNDPITYLETLQRIISGNDLNAPKELRKSLENINEEILNLIWDYSKRKKINEELKKQNKKIIKRQNDNNKIIQFKKILK